MNYKQALLSKNEQALAAEILGAKYCMNPEVIYTWANRFNIELMEQGYILAKMSNHYSFLCDVLNNRLELCRDLVGDRKLK